MHTIRVYADTSVFGGIEDAPFADASERFFQRVRKGEIILLLSASTVEELEPAPQPVRRLLEDLPTDCVERVASGEEVAALAQAYIQAGAIGAASRMDAIHVAAATVARADLILSWNFKHIVNYDRIRKFNGVNALKGYAAVEIRSPLELSYGDEDEDL